MFAAVTGTAMSRLSVSDTMRRLRADAGSYGRMAARSAFSMSDGYLGARRDDRQRRRSQGEAITRWSRRVGETCAQPISSSVLPLVSGTHLMMNGTARVAKIA